MHRIRATNHDKLYYLMSHWMSLPSPVSKHVRQSLHSPLPASLQLHVTCHQFFTWMQASFLVKRPDLLGCTQFLTSITDSAITAFALLADMSCLDPCPDFSCGL